MGIDLVRESSDVFFPLRAVVGALSVLITNYDVGLRVSSYTYR